MVATNLYVLHQAAKRPASMKSSKTHWFDTKPNPLPSRGDKFFYGDVQIEIGEGDVFVKLFNGATAQRTYKAITTCHLCKLELSKATSDANPTTSRCTLCAERKKAYHRVAEFRVRHVLKMGYQRMYGPFCIEGTAPLPFPDNLHEVDPVVVGEILADCRADLDMGVPLFENLKDKVVGGYQHMVGHQRMILVRKYGPNVFKLSPKIEKVVKGETGHEIVAQLSLDGGRDLLRDLQVDIAVYRKVWSHMRRMGCNKKGRRR